jgi:hypothetical protein
MLQSMIDRAADFSGIQPDRVRESAAIYFTSTENSKLKTEN